MNVSAQRDPAFFSSVEAILKNAKGQKFVNLAGNKEKLGDQAFTESLVSVIKIGQGKYSSDWANDYSGMDWGSLKYYFSSAPGNDKLRELNLEFKTEFAQHMYVKDKPGSDYNYKTTSFTLYFMEKDYEKLKALFESHYHR